MFLKYTWNNQSHEVSLVEASLKLLRLQLVNCPSIRSSQSGKHDVLSISQEQNLTNRDLTMRISPR